MRRLILAAFLLAACNANHTNADGGGTDGGSDGGTDGMSGPMCGALRSGARREVQSVFADNAVWLYGGDKHPFTGGASLEKQYVAELWKYDPVACSFQMLNATDPGARGGYAAAFDQQRDRIVYFGGRAGTGISPPLVNDVWALDLKSTTWKKLAPTGTAPTPRVGHGAVYDAKNDRLLVFGGDTSTSFAGIIGELWQLSFAGSADGAWMQLQPAGAPTPRRDAAITVDSKRGKMLVLGGAQSFTNYLDEVWAFDLAASTWAQVSVMGALPTQRFGWRADDDAKNDQVLLFGGHDAGALGLLNDLWSLKLDAAGATGSYTTLIAGDTDLSTAGVDKASPERRERFGFAVVGETLHMLFGGGDCGPLDDVWTFDLKQTTAFAWKKAYPAQVGETCFRRAGDGQQCTPGTAMECAAPF